MSTQLSHVMPPVTTPVCVVLDTNIVLDLWLYQDPATPALQAALGDKTVRWLATQVMRDELERVLAYTHIVARMTANDITAEHILNRFDAHALLMPIAAKAQFVCKDPDDQKFIDLAAAHTAQLISKDKAVLTMRNRMARLGVAVARSFPALLP
ncbi:putative toxin-antitoxin system toxin component, PIN family [Limnohabitans sp. JirII-31]|uniref:putative toxin-antitoxin system toxin component, PIN family n=1 Tax=Limnohabitans sp. JirII-31 TaxID=1977908 RepID=UPI000C1F0A9D|nr:putative toxin-antitoxin system toxin component, PIN family [Limnohabitans sp. JirII-31]PIT75219.1 putative toxin-antitoxin system toxin component, PIN family [Limnohabitans sp. JirII-31]